MKAFYHGETGLDLYAFIRDEAGEYWNVSEFEEYDDTNWGDYAIALTEDGASGNYAFDIPAALPAGNYVVTVRSRLGVSPAEGDTNFPPSILNWDGAAIIDSGSALAALKAYGDLNWKTITAAAVAGAVLVTPANKVACDGSGYVTTTGASNTTAATAVWASASRTLSSYGSLVTDIATAVWGAASRTLSAFSFTVVTSPTTTALKAILDKLDTMLEGAGPYLFTGASLVNAPVSDATLAKQDAILAAIDAVPTAAENVTALLEAAVEGTLTVQEALRDMRSQAVGKVVRTDTDPFTYDFYDKAGTTVLFSLAVPTTGATRTYTEA